MNTKHVTKEDIEESEERTSLTECALCKDKFTSMCEFQEHIGEHLEEIEKVDIDSY